MICGAAVIGSKLLRKVNVRAAIRAGYSAAEAAVIGSKLLRKVNVQAAIQPRR